MIHDGIKTPAITDIFALQYRSIFSFGLRHQFKPCQKFKITARQGKYDLSLKLSESYFKVHFVLQIEAAIRIMD